MFWTERPKCTRAMVMPSLAPKNRLLEPLLWTELNGWAETYVSTSMSEDSIIMVLAASSNKVGSSKAVGSTSKVEEASTNKAEVSTSRVEGLTNKEVDLTNQAADLISKVVGVDLTKEVGSTKEDMIIKILDSINKAREDSPEVLVKHLETEEVIDLKVSGQSTIRLQSMMGKSVRN